MLKLLFLFFLLGLGNASAGDQSQLKIGMGVSPGLIQSDRSLKSLLLKAPFLSNLRLNYQPVPVHLDRKEELAQLPFLYLRGDYSIDHLDSTSRENLRRYLTLGGFVLFDDVRGSYDSPFMISVRKLLKELFPDQDLVKIAKGDVLYQSFYLLDYAVGRVIERAYLHGLKIANRTAVLLCYNDLGGAWEKDLTGHYLNEVKPGDETQRVLAYRLGVNILFYALTLDYKADLVHIPEILKRRKLQKNKSGGNNTE